MQDKIKLIIDCDPGQDDALALAWAFARSDRLDLLGVSACAGNVPLELTARNARLICELCGQDSASLGVYAGSPRPLARDLVTAEYVHGNSGLDGIEIFEPDYPLQSEHAVDFICRTLLRAPAKSVVLVPTGPLTNIARALRQEPNIKSAIHSIVLMGGAMREAGNVTPSAEFNIYVDPEAAAEVFASGLEIVVHSLDVTHQVVVRAEHQQRLRAQGGAAATQLADLLQYYQRFDSERYGIDGAPLHDPCTVAWLLYPELFRAKRVNVSVECQSELTRGHTAVDFWGMTDKLENAHWVYAVDAAALLNCMIEDLARLA